MKIFIGWDSNQPIASEVAEYSLRRHATTDLEIFHIKKHEVQEHGIYYRPEGDPASTEFTYTRFLTPYLSDYKGLSMFVDSDWLFTADINELFDIAKNDPKRVETAIWVCKHPEYVPKNNVKFMNKPQLTFPRKNWSSLMIFNNEHQATRQLNPLNVSNNTPQWLHRLTWTGHHRIGSLPLEWNWLIGEYDKLDTTPPGIHYTNGGPFNLVYGQDYEKMWEQYLKEMLDENQ
jgi:lipopolysaccharide biosynthesis glycosyltransferase